ncbi:conserved hypothetical protein [Desulfamplus magnetovallimortis]|uniref:Exopolyphosphatase-related protein n=1 Tax=Desulfamplus magnetovallimortis TaxID=1246637 RepID=A0A1W1H7E2_9BACT|nr:exopolyphosphatase [Desulfamplus magnetovallimortis]SLM28387.1 conserved hypothetical protein [Desulfamplus magnetovallimortis]
MTRIVTRPDFDGIVCAAMILEALESEINTTDSENIPILWLEPSQVQHGDADIKEGDIMANLPFDPRCSVWFDHHVSNDRNHDVEGLFRIAPSAAGLVYEYYKEKGMINRDFDELIKETDIIDAALLSRDQVLYPEAYPYVLLSMTVKNRNDSDPPYWMRLVDLLRSSSIENIHKDNEVTKRCQKVIEENRLYEDILKKYTQIHGNICVTDFRSLEKAPSGNRFLPYSIFSDCVASMKIRYDHRDKNIVLVSIGKSIFKDGFNINIGKLLARYGGGGHAGAGGCSMEKSVAQKNIDEIIEIMKKSNQEQYL